jgi:hypothetical protein
VYTLNGKSFSETINQDENTISKIQKKIAIDNNEGIIIGDLSEPNFKAISYIYLYHPSKNDSIVRLSLQSNAALDSPEWANQKETFIQMAKTLKFSTNQANQSNQLGIDQQSAINIAKSVDYDGDGFSNYDDNCPGEPNADQKDSNGNRLGDICEGPDYMALRIKDHISYNSYGKIKADEIKVTKTERVTWSNTCYDIPTKIIYTNPENNPCLKKEPTQGYRILLQSQGISYEYRTNNTDDFREYQPEEN